MKKIIKKYRGVIAFYLLIVAAVMMLNARFEYLNNANDSNFTNGIIAIKN